MTKIFQFIRKIDFGDVAMSVMDFTCKAIVWAVIIMICAFAFGFIVGFALWLCWGLIELFAIGLDFALNLTGFGW